MNETITKDVEVLNREIDTAPEAGGLVKASQENVEDIQYLAQNIEKIIEAQNKIRAAVLKLAMPGDWVLFDDTAEIGFAGANRIASTLGVSFTDFEAVKEQGTDEIGDWYRWEFECNAIYRNRTIRVYGRAGSRDKFFGKAHGEFKRLHEIDEGNIKISARRAAMKEGVKCLFGLHHCDPEFLKKYGIKLESAGGHSFKSQGQQAAEAESATVQISNVTMKSGTNKTSGKPWTKYSVEDSEGVIYSTFSESMATEAKKSKESKGPANLTFKKSEYGPELLSINGVASSEKRG